jgi:hypothetical protein
VTSVCRRTGPPEGVSARGAVGALVEEIVEQVAWRAAHAVPRLRAWRRFFVQRLAEPLDVLAHCPAPRTGRLRAVEPLPEVDEFGDVAAEVETLHVLSEAEMRRIDPLLHQVPELMRRHPDFRRFEGEEIVASWVSETGVPVPAALPSCGTRPQGGYIMHMANNARQTAHLHGIRRRDGTFVPDTGGRLLIGLVGARRSTIRHPRGVIRVPRGALVRIHFPQRAEGPTAHQFWNEDGTAGVGNVLFSFHERDFLPDGEPSEVRCGTEMMARRTYALSALALERNRHHGFVG